MEEASMRRRAAIVMSAALAAVPAVALAGVPQYSGSAGKASIGIEVKRSGNTVKRVKNFSWDGLKCGGDRFTGGTSKSIRVKAGAFSSKQPVGGVDVALTLRLRGKFTNNGTKAHGTLKITGACKTGRIKWHATLQQQQQG
jgi:hypothetical protein